MEASTVIPDRFEPWVRSIEEDPTIDQLVERVHRVAEPLGRDPWGPVLQGRRLGHPLHPMLVDVVLGCWTSATLLDVFGGRSSRVASRRLIGLGLMLVPGTVAAGLSDWTTLGSASSRRVGAVHGVANVAVSACYLRSWRCRRKERHLRGIAWSLLGGSAAFASAYLGSRVAEHRTVDLALAPPVPDEGLRRAMAAEPSAATPQTVISGSGAPGDLDEPRL